MTEKRFELKVNQHDQCDIVDWVESKKKNAICIYNDLGCYHFSSAKALCELLNELAEENTELHIQNDFLKDENQHMRDLVNENKQLKSDNFNLNKTVECLDKTVKEQCNKIDWADECGVRWEEGYTKWIGGKND